MDVVAGMKIGQEIVEGKLVKDKNGQDGKGNEKDGISPVYFGQFEPGCHGRKNKPSCLGDNQVEEIRDKKKNPRRFGGRRHHSPNSCPPVLFSLEIIHGGNDAGDKKRLGTADRADD